jgi:hypothetical protein
LRVTGKKRKLSDIGDIGIQTRVFRLWGVERNGSKIENKDFGKI